MRIVVGYRLEAVEPFVIVCVFRFQTGSPQFGFRLREDPVGAQLWNNSLPGGGVKARKVEISVLCLTS